MSKLKNAQKFAIVTSGTVAPLLPLAAHADTAINEGADVAQPTGTTSDLQAQVKTVTNTLLLVIGIVAVIMLIVGGFRYVLSGGNEKNTAAAKDTILYAIIGIVVALLSYAIVNFVLGRFS